MSTGREHGHPFLAAVYDAVLGPFEARFRPYRVSLLSHARGRVLEVGAGTGTNLPLLATIDAIDPPIFALEPDPYMLQHAEQRATEVDFPVELVQGDAQQLPFDAATFDTVVGTLVMCTVSNPNQALGEIRRVLKPGGSYLFIEHVRSDETWAEWLQTAATPIWKRVAGGCELNRDTVDTIRSQGFLLDACEELDVSSPLLPMVMGVAHPTTSEPEGHGQ